MCVLITLSDNVREMQNNFSFLQKQTNKKRRKRAPGAPEQNGAHTQKVVEGPDCCEVVSASNLLSERRHGAPSSSL